MENLYEDDAEAHSVELAHHFGEAQTLLGSEKLVIYSLLAGERALASYGYEEAMGHFQRALAAKEGQPLDTETAQLLDGLGRAQLATLERYQMQEAVGSLSRAFEYFVQTGDVPRAVAIAEIPLIGPAGSIAQTARLVPRALALVPADSHEAGRLLSRQGWELGRWQGDYDGSQEAFMRALAIAQREGNVALEMSTLAYACYVDSFHMQWPEGLENGLKAIELGRRTDDLASEFTARHYSARILIDTGNLEQAQLHAAASLDLAERMRDRGLICAALWKNGNLSQAEGDWRTAREFSDRGLAIMPLEFRLLGTRILLEYETGDFSQGNMFLERLLALFERELTDVEAAYESVSRLLNPEAADDDWLRFLSSWLALVFDPSWPIERRRQLVLDDCADRVRAA